MALLTLLTTKGQMHRAGGLNWGLNLANHTRRFDAYIPIHIGPIRQNPGFFPPKANPNPVLNFTWDDGTVMQGKFEGTQTDSRTGIDYPKNLSSYPNKDIMGLYLRRRLGINGPVAITIADLQRHGRTNVEILHLGGNNYSIDFS